MLSPFTEFPDSYPDDDHELAELLATEAMRRLATLRTALFSERGSNYSMQYTADRAAHVFLSQALAAARPTDAVLSEEGRDTSDRLSNSRVWIVDPLDGSADFGDRWSEEWAVHVALCVEGVAVAGCVASPRGISTTRSPVTLSAFSSDRAPRIVVSRSRLHNDGRFLTAALGAEVGAVGSAGIKTQIVLEGVVDAYLHAGGIYEWDTCAPVAAAEAAGLRCHRIDGSNMRYNNRDPFQPGLVVVHPEFADQLLAAIS